MTRSELIAALRGLVPEWMETSDAEQVLAVRHDKIVELIGLAEATEEVSIFPFFPSGCYHQFGLCHGTLLAEKWDDPLVHRA